MFIRFFRSSQPLQIIVFCLFCLVLWATGFKFQEEETSGMPLYRLLKLLLGISPWISSVFTVLLAVGQAFLVRSIADSNLPGLRNSMLPAVVFVVLAFAFPLWFLAQPYIVANTILLLLFIKIHVFYRQENVLSDSFDAGLLVGLMTLFYLPSLPLFLLVWAALAVFRPFNWREWLVALLGLGFPFLVTLVYYFATDGLGDLFMEIIPNALTSVQLLGISYLPFLIGLTVLLLPSLFTFFSTTNSAGVKANKTAGLLMWLGGFTILAWLVLGQNLGTFYFLCLPLSVIVANYLVSIKRVWVAEMLFICLLVLLLYGHMQGLLAR